MLALHGTVPSSVQATVHEGHVTLTGTVEWAYQKRDAVQHVRGVREVINRVSVRPSRESTPNGIG